MFDGLEPPNATQNGPSLTAKHLAAWAALTTVLILASIQWLDRPFADFSHDFLARPTAALWLVKIGGAPVLIAAGLLATLAAFASGAKYRPVGRAFATALLAALLAMLAVIALKQGFGRLWPETWVNNNPSWIANHAFGFYWFHGGVAYESFPSGHTARTLAPCAALWWRMPRLRPLWAALPMLVVLGLLGSNFHFVSDCLAGAAVGLIAALVALRLAPRLRIGR